ncbi:hypothetical protein ACPV54_18885 [Vibrio mediterranei]
MTQLHLDSPLQEANAEWYQIASLEVTPRVVSNRTSSWLATLLSRFLTF